MQTTTEQQTKKDVRKTTRWVSDPSHSAASFEVKHMMVSTVRGVFRPIEATLSFDEAEPTRSRVEVKVPVAAIDTRDDNRDAHLRSADFFDAEHFPYLTFESKEIERTGDLAYRVAGELTIRGTTRPVEVDVEATGEVKNPMTGQPTRGYEVHAKIDRKDFGLNWNKALEAGGWLVGDKVKITVDLELIPAER